MSFDPVTLSILGLITSVLFSALAIFIAWTGIYLQFLRVWGPHIECLSPQYMQRARVLPYDALPMTIQSDFPQVPADHPNYFIVDVVFANSGDRTGFIWVGSFTGQLNKQEIRTSFYNYTVIQPGGVIVHRALARNAPDLSAETPIAMQVVWKWGGIRRRKYTSSTEQHSMVPITLIPRTI